MLSNDKAFPGAWQRALLPLSLLDALEAGPNHGYALERMLEARGFSPIKGSTLYPALVKLEAAGLMDSIWEDGDGAPGRKVYTLTGTGRGHLAAQRELWAFFQDAVLRE
ncbi:MULTISPECIES: PadR family transcriptional regulator [Paeniglutamicibacter]|uniref:PadR family transcriptional regulator PadR n=1 Tax=Paeniglutamicibacter sulfureus TaxID=43666 RepID=A0ABU2BDG7_9MICC|nr:MULTISPECIES: PadR family transcriptional regulator [Paeniglutamicibacter]MCV9993649.1 PadR family transcriptional regulator [Paeniglutamicibacter sp. ZC-3]MDO2936351.1 PadR family transcriptional regulator [Paeniglutamicibacter sulfureus]MDR7356643.1 PadR family transcriptional regulator PadR [Paeniglutamicibacter sulfureus]